MRGGKRRERGLRVCEGEKAGWSPSTLRVHCSAPSGVRRATIADQTAAAGQIYPIPTPVVGVRGIIITVITIVVVHRITE